MKKAILILTALVYNQIAIAHSTFVSSIAALQVAVNSAATGDTIVLTNGAYVNNTLTISTNSITIKAQTAGSVFLNGTNSITINSNFVSLYGFQFTSGTVTGDAITVNGSHNMISQLNFNGYNARHMVIISGQNNLISYCNFQNKPATNLVNHGGTGDMIQIIPNSTIPGYNTIRYCSFKHMPGFGGDYGNECIRIGDGAYSTYISRTLVEYCYFEDTGNGDSEAISVKSKENCLRFNTMNNNPNAMFSFRNGDNNVAYSNFFLKSGGIRCKQSNNIYCYNNYFQQSGINQNSSLPGSGVNPVTLEYFGTGYGNNFNFIHNTFYKSIDSKIASGLTNCTWANNIFYSDSSTIFSGTNSGQSYAGNIYQGTLGLTIASGMNNINPQLVLNAHNYYGLSATSPAIAASSSSYPSIISITGLNNDAGILLDIDGQSRLTLKDVGCDQYTSGAAVNYPLDSCQTGPFYLCQNITTSINALAFSVDNISIYPNPSGGEFTVLINENDAEINVINLLGQIVIKTKVENGSVKLKIDNDGVYTICVKTLHANVTQKLLVDSGY